MLHVVRSRAIKKSAQSDLRVAVCRFRPRSQPKKSGRQIQRLLVAPLGIACKCLCTRSSTREKRRSAQPENEAICLENSTWLPEQTDKIVGMRLSSGNRQRATAQLTAIGAFPVPLQKAKLTRLNNNFAAWKTKTVDQFTGHQSMCGATFFDASDAFNCK